MVIAQPAMMNNKTSAVTPGQMKVKIPVAIPSRPTRASHQRPAEAPPLIAAKRAIAVDQYKRA